MSHTKFLVSAIVFAVAIPWLGQPGAGGASKPTVLASKPVTAEPRATVGPEGPDDQQASLPPGTDPGWWAKVQESIRKDEYTLAWRAADSAKGVGDCWAGFNRAQGFETRFAETGFVTRPVKEGACWEWGLSLAAWGRSGAMQPAGKAALRVDKNRLEADRPGIGEWFVNDEKGLEQGFTIPAPPESKLSAINSQLTAEDGASFTQHSSLGTQHFLDIDLASAGTLHPRISEDGQAVDFYDNGNVSVIHYAQLKATDATGRELPARFEGFCDEGSGGIRISIVDTGAVYPIAVDPLATSPAWTGTGDADYADFGYSVATAGDVNGDGYSDILVGAPYHPAGGTNRGHAYVYLGSASGPSTLPAWTGSGDADSACFGTSVATAGDINGDGYSDVIVSAPSHPAGGTNRGRAYVYLGSATGPSATPVWAVSGDQDGAWFGSSVAAAGDVNGDGYSDIIAGAAGHNAGGTLRGRAYVYLGSASGPATTAAWTGTGDQDNAYFGYSVSTAGDVDGDGYSDIVVGAPTHPAGGAYRGRAYVYLGSASGPSATAVWTGSGDQDEAYFGWSVATAGDVNGDGYSDILVGAPNHPGDGNRRGRAYAYLGSASGPSTTAAWIGSGDTDNAYFGWSVATAGDVNGDGFSDILAGAPGHPAGGASRGQAYVYLGSASGPSATAAWTGSGDVDNANFGHSVATAGDVNGDGYSDILAGAPGFPAGGANRGQAYVYLGSASGLSNTSSWTTAGEAGNNHFGNSVSTAGDVNGDGYSDVIVGAYGYSSNTGKAYLYLGGPSGLSATPSWTAAGEATSNYFGYSVATAGDVNGDGYSDVIVGAYGYSGNKGKAYFYMGGPSGLSALASWTTAAASADYLGECVATAGDVNGDGYSDVIVGAYGQASWTGGAYLFLGGASGLSTTSSWAAAGEAANGWFGGSVATAGDVNGDGYSDVVVAAFNYNSATGKAYLFLGGPSGLSGTPSWTATGEAAFNNFGMALATAGDVNGDGYSDVLVGARGYNGNGGKAYLYLGGPPGLSATATWTDAGSLGDYYGQSVAGGDVNGDGYSDVVVGASGLGDYGGEAYLYLGGPSGPSATPSWTASGEATFNYFGCSVAAGGDVNGDGFSDVIVGAYGNVSNTGKAYLYYGNGGPGLPLKPQQLRADGSAPIAPLGRTTDGTVRIKTRGRTPFGRGDVKLEWQIAPLVGNFSLAMNPYQSALSWLDCGANGVTLQQELPLQARFWPWFLPQDEGPYIWRVRTKYSPANTPFQGHGPWLTLAANGQRETDLRRMPACALPDEPCWLYSVVKSGTDYTLNWQDPNQPDQRTGWNIRRSNNPALPRASWPLVGSNVVDMDQGTANYQWTDHSGDDPAPSLVWYYEVTTYNSNCPAEGPF